jgi:RNA polymerase sigma-70 factor (ECF subfamily)
MTADDRPINGSPASPEVLAGAALGDVVDWRRRIELLYREHGDRLWRAVYMFGGDAELASDAVAEAYAQALRRGKAIRDPAAWVWRSAFRIAAGMLKDRATTHDLPRRRDGHVDHYADGDLLQAVRQLPDAQRAAVILFYFADLPVGVIARRLGSNQLAVRANLSRARRRLHALLGDHDG